MNEVSAGVFPQGPVWALLVAAATGQALVWTRRWHGGLTFDTTVGAQKFHSAPTPRIGGVAVVAGLLAALAMTPSLRPMLGAMLVAGIPAFSAGLAEDVTKRVSVSVRLGATVLSGIVICNVSGVWLTSVDVPIVDTVFAVPFLAVLMTAIALAGVANAVNMIDGFNGLAAGVAIIVLSTLGAIAADVGDREMSAVCFVAAAAMFGFLLVNFPGGRLFLGDGGAYLLGFCIGWLCVLLVERNPGKVSPWVGMVVCAYPVLEMFFSMWRKTRREGSHMSRPDRVHLHMLIHRRVVRPRLNGASRALQNAMTAPVSWLLALCFAGPAVLLYESTVALMFVFLICACVYGAIYARLTQFRWRVLPSVRRGAARMHD